MATDVPEVLDLTIRGGVKWPGELRQLTNYNHTDAVPSYADVSGTWRWVFRRSAESDVELLDASARIAVLDEDAGVVQVGPLTAADTETLTGVGVWQVTLDGLPIMEGRFTARPGSARA